MISFPFNFARFVAIIRKEFIQMRRDRLTFAMMFGIPILQLILFGFAINSDPKNLPVAVLASDNSPFARRFVHAMENSGYFQIADHVETEDDARELLARGEVQFVLNLPSDFSRKLVRGERPAMLVASRCDRSFRGQLGCSSHERNLADGLRPRFGRTVAKTRRHNAGRSSCGSTSSTIPIASRNTTSFPV